MATPVQVGTIEEGAASGGSVALPDSPAVAGNTLVALCWGRGSQTGAAECGDNLDPGVATWDEHAESGLYNGSTGTLFLFTKLAEGGETSVTMSTPCTGNKAFLAVFELAGAVDLTVLSGSGSSGSGGVMNWTTGDLGSVQDLLIAAINITADDLSHDYAGTIVGGTEVADGTIGNNFSPGYYLGYGEDVASLSGTWNHHPQSYVSLAIGIAAEPEPIVPGIEFSVDGVAFDNLLEQKIRVELNAAGEGHFVISKQDPQATATMLYRGARVVVTIPEIHSGPLFEFFIEDGDFEI